jgi:hypothetical protein
LGVGFLNSNMTRLVAAGVLLVTALVISLTSGASSQETHSHDEELECGGQGLHILSFAVLADRGGAETPDMALQAELERIEGSDAAERMHTDSTISRSPSEGEELVEIRDGGTEGPKVFSAHIQELPRDGTFAVKHWQACRTWLFPDAADIDLGAEDKEERVG